jgi:hypothetical protein
MATPDTNTGTNQIAKQQSNILDEHSYNAISGGPGDSSNHLDSLHQRNGGSAAPLPLKLACPSSCGSLLETRCVLPILCV